MNKKSPHFSLIVPTINKSEELDHLIQSLLNQTFKNFELIIIDQNIDNKVLAVTEKYKNDLIISYIKNNKKGLSLNRNIGISASQGKIICFPDDDCTYPPKTLEIVNDFFYKNSEYQIYSSCVKDNKLNKRFVMANKDATLSPYNYFNKSISIGLFIKPYHLNDLSFDIQMGVGAPFGSAEESDLVSSLLNKGYKGKYFATNYVYHDFPSISPDPLRFLNYGMGYGALMKKEILIRKKYRYIISFLFDLTGRLILSALPSTKRKLYLNSLIGRIKGFTKYSL